MVRLHRKQVLAFVSLFALIGVVGFFVAHTPHLPNHGTFQEYSDYFHNLAVEKGAAYAYGVMREESFPSNIDLHLLGHVVGDVLYEQQGVAGIKVCTNDFRNACSHSIVIGAFLEKGEAALPEIARACQEAPGGSGAYTMCFHGLGHGILSYVGYDLPHAIAMCKKTGTPAHHNQEYVECVGGTIMEMQWGAFDPQTWAVQAKKYFKADDATYPCSADFMPQEVRGICYDYLTPYLWKFVGGDVGFPTPSIFEKAFKLCEGVPSRADRDACYGGFGKEFDGLVLSRDIRLDALNHLSDDALGTIYGWCTLAPEAEGVEACTRSALGSLYWGGENERTVAERFCAMIPADTSYQAGCYDELIRNVRTYIADTAYRKEFCAELPVSQQGRCTDMLL